MTNKDIARQFSLLADLMKLHGEEDYRSKTYDFAYRNLRAVAEPLANMSVAELKNIKGIGDAISQKIREIVEKGEMTLLKEYKQRTPDGLLDLMEIKGLGPGKLKTLWDELNIESAGELLYACHENRLTLLKGFGDKTQTSIREQVEFFLRSKDNYRWANVEEEASDLLDDLRDCFGTDMIEFTGDFRRLMPVVKGISFLCAIEHPQAAFDQGLLELLEEKPEGFRCQTPKGLAVRIICCAEEDFGLNWLQSTGSAAFVTELLRGQDLGQFKHMSEEEIFDSLGEAYVPAECREQAKTLFWAKVNSFDNLVDLPDIKGVIHAHSNYSDGAASLRDMALQCQAEGYEYLGITDHSKSAFYANGLKEDRVLAQMAEIDQLNAELAPFRIFKGIESDILNDGRLDYEENILKQFDFIIASIHSNLRMDELKATERLIRAIENPYTTILGHPTGRLLLSRNGYPINHQKVIDACADNGVAIELNASPYRLDLDWTWIPYALEKGVLISINPDAHSLAGINDIRYGAMTARKGLLLRDACLNALDLEGFEDYLRGRNRR
jgi:DNA polymerase (family 10)